MTVLLNVFEVFSLLIRAKTAVVSIESIFKFNFTSNSMNKTISLTIALSLFILCVFATACSRANKKEFTEAEVAEVKALMKDVNPATYRLVLPTIKDQQVIGSEVQGSLPITEVRRLASVRKIDFKDTGNLQAIFDPNEAGQSGGQQTPDEKPARTGQDLANRIEKILQGLDKSQYVLIH